jgi:hypothetical protein
VFFQVASNYQSMSHTFINCWLIHWNGGTIWDLNGGNVVVLGGYSTMRGDTTPGVVFKTGISHSSQLTPAIAAYSHQTELAETGGYADLSGSQLACTNCNPRLIGNTRTSPHVVVRLKGSFHFVGGMIDDLSFASSTDVLNNYWTSERNEIVIKDSIVKNPALMTDKYTRYTTAGDGLTTLLDLTSHYTGSSGLPRIYMDGCRPRDVNLTVEPYVAPNGAPFASRGGSGRAAPSQVQYMNAKSSHMDALPPSGGTRSVRIPTYCEVSRVVLSKQGGSGAGTWQVADGNGAVLVTLSATAGEAFKSAVVDVYRRVDTVQDATFTLSNVSGGAAIGTFRVEYV